MGFLSMDLPPSGNTDLMASGLSGPIQARVSQSSHEIPTRYPEKVIELNAKVRVCVLGVRIELSEGQQRVSERLLANT
jgi:hypothetical protein